MDRTRSRALVGLTWLAAITPLALAACSKPAPPRLTARFTKVAALALPSGDSTHIEAALATLEASKEEVDGALDLLKRGLLTPRDMPRAAKAIVAELLAAFDADEVLPESRCDAPVLAPYDLARLLFATAPLGDTAQLEATAWLGARIREQRASLLGVMMALDLGEDVAERSKAESLAPTARMKQAMLPPDDLVARTFAREALCVESRMGTIRGDAKGLEAAVLADEAGDVLAAFEAIMDRVDAAADAHAAAQVVAAEHEALRAGDDTVIASIAVSGSTWRDLETKRAELAHFFGLDARRAVERTARALAAGDVERIVRAGETLDLFDADPGVRLLGLDRSHAWYGLGLDNGDVLVSLDGFPLDALTLLSRLRDAGEGTHRLVVRGRIGERRAKLVIGDPNAVVARAPTPEPATPEPATPEPHIAADAPDAEAPDADTRAADAPDTRDAPAAPEPIRVIAKNDAVRVFRKPRFADARRLREELEAGAATFTFDPVNGVFLIAHVRSGSLVEELGFQSGDALEMIGDRSATTADREGQGGIGFLVDGLDGDDVRALVYRRADVIVLRWQFQ